jgi:hypothetical protein
VKDPVKVDEKNIIENKPSIAPEMQNEQVQKIAPDPILDLPIENPSDPEKLPLPIELPNPTVEPLPHPTEKLDLIDDLTEGSIPNPVNIEIPAKPINAN